jgi:integrase/recombinase XerD
MNDPSRVFVSGPFAAFRERFLRSLLKWEYTPDSAANQLHLMAHLSRWLAGEGLDVQTFRETICNDTFSSGVTLGTPTA